MKFVAPFFTMLLSAPVYGQDLPVEQTNLRYDEDWSALRDDDAATPGWAAIKHLPLSLDGMVWLSTGLEQRIRYEARRDGPARSFVRILPHADLHMPGFRLFAQGIAGYASGLARAKGPSDETGIDLLQGFAEVELPLGSGTGTLRAGRQLAAVGSERLIGIRYGPNIPQPFDGLRATYDRGRLHLSLFRLNPVVIGPNDLDDRTSSTRRISGIYATVPLTQAGSMDAYWLSYRNDEAVYDQGRGTERRETFGLRLWGASAGWRWNWEALVQRGRFANADIAAWSIATETGYAFTRFPMRPIVTLRANIASGDKSRSDPTLNSFNALFPRGKYFGEYSPIGPRNIVNLHARIDLTPARNVTLGLSAEGYWRHRRGDGVYDLSGNLLGSGSSSAPRSIGTQEELVLGWTPSPILSLSASLSHFTPGAFLRRASGQRSTVQLGLEARLRI